MQNVSFAENYVIYIFSVTEIVHGPFNTPWAQWQDQKWTVRVEIPTHGSSFQELTDFPNKMVHGSWSNKRNVFWSELSWVSQV